MLSEPYVGKLAWVRREIIVDSEQEEPLTRGSRSEYMSIVDVMSDGLEHVLLVARIDFQKGRGVW